MDRSRIPVILDHTATSRPSSAFPPAPPARVLPAGAADLTGEVFAPRAMFGSYVAAQLAPLLDDGRIQHVRAMVVGVDRNKRYTLRLSDGGAMQADLIILAASHPKAALPKERAALSGHAAVVADPLAPNAPDGIEHDERVLIIGNDLTSADIVATLRRRGHRAQITALSRHGWRSMPHGPKQGDTVADFASDPARSALGLYRRERQAVVSDATAGLTWHAAFDRLRAQGPAVWATLPDPQRHRPGAWRDHCGDACVG